MIILAEGFTNRGLSVIKSVIISAAIFFYFLGGWFMKNFFFLCGFKITPIKNLYFLIKKTKLFDIELSFRYRFYNFDIELKKPIFLKIKLKIDILY